MRRRGWVQEQPHRDKGHGGWDEGFVEGKPGRRISFEMQTNKMIFLKAYYKCKSCVSFVW